VLYTGVTNDINRRISEHKGRLVDGFTKRYNLTKVIYVEEFKNVTDAIAAEKKIKGWIRSKKISLIETNNPEWQDLGDPSLRSG